MCIKKLNLNKVTSITFKKEYANKQNTFTVIYIFGSELYLLTSNDEIVDEEGSTYLRKKEKQNILSVSYTT